MQDIPEGEVNPYAVEVLCFRQAVFPPQLAFSAHRQQTAIFQIQGDLVLLCFVIPE
jgi:hypothetical protein